MEGGAVFPESMTCDPGLARSGVLTAAIMSQNSWLVQAVKLSLCVQDSTTHSCSAVPQPKWLPVCNNKQVFQPLLGGLPWQVSGSPCPKRDKTVAYYCYSRAQKPYMHSSTQGNKKSKQEG